MAGENNIPTEVRDTFKAIDYEIKLLHYSWQIYRQLYGTNEDRIKILNEVAPSFFLRLERIYYDYIQLSLSKLTDPAYSRVGGQQVANLTLKKLYEELSSVGYPNLHSLQSILNDLNENCEKIRINRNKQIAHFDHETSIDKNVKDRPSREKIENSLKLIRDFMNDIFGYYNNVTVYYEKTASPTDGEALILNLKKALRYQEIKKSGKIERNDLENFPYWNA